MIAVDGYKMLTVSIYIAALELRSRDMCKGGSGGFLRLLLTLRRFSRSLYLSRYLRLQGLGVPITFGLVQQRPWGGFASLLLVGVLLLPASCWH